MSLPKLIAHGHDLIHSSKDYGNIVLFTVFPYYLLL